MPVYMCKCVCVDLYQLVYCWVKKTKKASKFNIILLVSWVAGGGDPSFFWQLGVVFHFCFPFFSSLMKPRISDGHVATQNKDCIYFPSLKSIAVMYKTARTCFVLFCKEHAVSFFFSFLLAGRHRQRWDGTASSRLKGGGCVSSSKATRVQDTHNGLTRVGW